jgi:metallo-beta-lactamase family protein
MIPVHADVALVESMSAHADSNEIHRWLAGFTRPPRITFIVHGEPVAMEALGASIHERLGWATRMPEYGETVVLDALQ